MDEDVIISITVFLTLAVCASAVLIGNFVCPPTRPKRGMSYLEDDDFD